MKTQSVWTPRPLPGLESAFPPLARCRAAGVLAPHRPPGSAVGSGGADRRVDPRRTAAAPARTLRACGRQDPCCVSRAPCDRRGSARGPPVASGGARRSGDVGVPGHLLSVCVRFLESPLVLTAPFRRFTGRAPPAPPVCPRAGRGGRGPGRPARASLPCGSPHVARCGWLASPWPRGGRGMRLPPGSLRLSRRRRLLRRCGPQEAFAGDAALGAQGRHGTPGRRGGAACRVCTWPLRPGGAAWGGWGRAPRGLGSASPALQRLRLLLARTVF